ncbi:hypothetical protein [Kutzneria sp. NPDC051319]|uniref:hypothetical protein n=1 Tax=Kutzneria sp. NPDC051319 TaxID=3155047 RepID=UPI00341AE8FE
MPKRTMVVAAVGAALLLAGCGQAQDTGKVASLNSSNPTTSGAPKKGGFELDDLRKYTKCLRDHGLDVPDPDPNGGRIKLAPDNPDDAKGKAAIEACKSLVPDSGPPPTMDADQLDKLHKKVQCMRDHGVHMDDPSPEKSLQIGGPGDDPAKVSAAAKACGFEFH